MRRMALLLFWCSMGSSLLTAAPCTEEQKIDFLIQSVAKLEGSFVRNGEEHSPEAAAAHLRTKLTQAQKSWFAPPKKTWTARMFIEKLAARSSVSGKPYLIRPKGQAEVTAEAWLMERAEKCVAPETTAKKP